MKEDVTQNEFSVYIDGTQWMIKKILAGFKRVFRAGKPVTKEKRKAMGNYAPVLKHPRDLG